MDFGSIVSSPLFVWIVLPFLIFLARISDVTLGTMRIIFISRGLKYVAPLVGFFEVVIWLLAIRIIMQNLNNFLCYIAYGTGFAMGILVGLHLEQRLALGSSLIRIITQKDATNLIEELRSKGYGVTNMEAQGKEGKVHVIFMVIRRSDFKDVDGIIKKMHPQAFYSVEDVNLVCKGIFPTRRHRLPLSHFYPHSWGRKTK